MAIGRERTETDRTVEYARQLEQGKTEAARLEGALSRAEAPLLFVGLGGTGCGVVARLKRRWELIPEDRRSSRVQFFCIDTTGFEDADYTDPVVREHIDASSEYLALCQPGVDYAKWYDAEKERLGTDFVTRHGWYDECQMPQGEQLGASGAGAYRQFGRLALDYSVDRVSHALAACAQKLTGASPGGRLATLQPPHVYVVAGMSGGTGSGIFLDVVRAVHHALDGYFPRVSAVLVLPDIYRESPKVAAAAKARMRPNAYALLKELDWIVALNRTKLEYRSSGLELPWFPTQTTPDTTAFAMPVYLLDMDLPAANISVRQIDDIKELAANGIFSLTMGMSEGQRRANIDEWISDETDDNRRRLYASFGMSRAFVPIYSMVHHLGLSLFARAVENGLLDRSQAGGSAEIESAVETLTQRLEAVASSAFDDRETGLALPRLNQEDVKARGATQAVSEYDRRLDDLLKDYKSDLSKTSAQTLEAAVATAENVVDQFLSERDDDLATTIGIIEGVTRSLGGKLADLTASDGGRAPGQSEAQARLTKHSTGILKSVLSMVGYDPIERTQALAEDATRPMRSEVLAQVSAVVNGERAAYYARLSDRAVLGQVWAGSSEPSSLGVRLTRALDARSRLKSAGQLAANETSSFRIRRQVDGEIGVTTLLFPAALTRQKADDRGPEEYMESLAKQLGVGKSEMAQHVSAALERAKAAKPGFALHRIEAPSGTDQLDGLDVLRGAFLKIAEEQLERIAPHLSAGLIATAEKDGVTLSEICDLLETYGAPPLRLSYEAARRYSSGAESPIITTWLGPVGVGTAFDELQKDGNWYDGPTDHELTRVFTEYGLAVEDIASQSEYRKEYHRFLVDRPTKTVHIAAGVADLITDPAGGSQEAALAEDAYERVALGLMLGMLFEAHENEPETVAAVKALVEMAPGLALGDLPAPIQKNKDGHYMLADYRVVMSGGVENVKLCSAQLVDLGPSISIAVRRLMDGAEGRAPAIELLAERVLSAGGPFAQGPADAVELLQSFLGWLENSIATAEGSAERVAFERLCIEIREEIAERSEILRNPNPFPKPSRPEAE